MSTALITGASSGLGIDFAHQFAKDGHDVVLLARSKPELESLAIELEKTYSIRATVIVADLSIEEEVSRIFPALQDLGIEIDYLVNNAGFGHHDAFSSLPWSAHQALMRVNMESLTQLTHEFLQPMLQKGRGKIMLVASTASFQPGPFMALYYASKAYVRSFGEALSKELEGSGVSVTILCPGPTQTPFFEKAGMNSMKLLNWGQMESSEKVAKYGYRQMMRGKRTVISGTLNALGAFATRLAPKGLQLSVVNWLHKNS